MRQWWCPLIIRECCVYYKLLNFHFTKIFIDTSREPREEELHQKGYNFLNKEEMYRSILAGKYYEWGETNGNYYGSKLSSIRDIIDSGKIALVDCDPSVSQNLFFWHTIVEVSSKCYLFKYIYWVSQKKFQCLAVSRRWKSNIEKSPF